MSRIIISVSLLLLAVIAFAGAALFDGGSPSRDAQADEPPSAVSLESTAIDLARSPKGVARKLQSPLAQISAAYGAFGPQGADIIAGGMGISTDGGVRVVVRTTKESTSGLLAAAATLGITVETSNRGLIQMSVPVASLAALAGHESVTAVRLPLRPIAADEITGKGVAVIGADDWLASGVTGSGSRIAIIDAGFEGYEALLGSELPESVEVRSCREDGDITAGGVAHGTAVTEIVHEVAPGASLYLLNFDTEVEFANCVDWVIEMGIDIVNMAIGYFATGPGDGTGFINEIVDAAIAQGVLWVNSAGNEAQQHWLGTWNDPDADGFLNFLDEDETNYVDARAGSFITVVLKWDDPFGTACNDYDLYLFDPAATTIVAGSEDFQDFCTSGFESFPVEFFSYEVPETGRYHIVIGSFDTDDQATFHLYSLTQSCPLLQYCTSSGSILEPADNPDVLTVGAVPWNDTGNIESFSSQGPTDDGRIKPDIVAPDGVSSVTFGSFFGTSAAVPHVSGAAGLVKQWQPEWDQNEIRDFLLSRAIDIAEPGLDNVTGRGLLDLGMPKPTPTPTNTQTPTYTPTPTQTATPSPTPTPTGPPGDVNCDRIVTVVDATLILQFNAALLQSLPCEAGADVNNDGRVDANDAVLILWVVGGLTS